MLFSTDKEYTSKRKTIAKHLYDVDPMSSTLAQHCTNVISGYTNTLCLLERDHVYQQNTRLRTSGIAAGTFVFILPPPPKQAYVNVIL